ncbi:thiolase family protein [Tropicibacter naphthalenivorans]|uniref:Acetyl-CoA acetyltransferase n=1 Tax=Tropicibacter naphthalenivorans TaxID=441103 RepID=A0A0P1GHW3_9RHOB|nr:thiolase family protein [Tropicibacter naphthalenivorans]CUH81204.1 Acetyl-CoA acetyltransferase [Tropicibacter naphthalenivorans]SMC97717.1 Acetyl-CoA acetyltransferase [Tropicibacter naphthalenivorans]
MTAYIPYGAYWSTPFARWQGSFSHLHSIEFAAHVAKSALAARSLTPETFDFAAYGMTVPQYRSFYGTPWFTALMGAEHLAGPTVNQACATGARLVATAMGEMAVSGVETALIASGDRTSNGPHAYYPAPDAPGGTGQGENIVMESFNRDPFAKCAMVDTADNVARKLGISTEEQHEVASFRAEQYAAALADDRAFQKRYMEAEFPVPDGRYRKTVKTLQGDEGIYPASPEKMAALKPVMPNGSVTFAGQTHPADGSAGMVLCASEARAQEIAPKSGPVTQVLAVAQGRDELAHMPAAPIRAAKRALKVAGLEIGQIDVFKSHNPFAVNDIAFARAFDLDWKRMNNYGSSLIWGHPQGPTGLRAMIEMIEELEMRGGGTGLFQGCAAGDSAMAVILKVG